MFTQLHFKATININTQQKGSEVKRIVLIPLVLALGCNSLKKSRDDSPQSSIHQTKKEHTEPEEKEEHPDVIKDSTPKSEPTVPFLDPEADNNKKQRQSHIVMMIDEGIDPNNKAYKDKVIASYTLTCDSYKTVLDATIQEPKELKKKILESLASKKKFTFDKECELKEGINHNTPAPSSYILNRRKEIPKLINNAFILFDP